MAAPENTAGQELAELLIDAGQRLPRIAPEDLADRVVYALKVHASEAEALQSLRAALSKPVFQSSREIDAVWKALEWGGRQFELFPRFMYRDYGRWKAVAEAMPYRALHEALAQVDRAIMPEVAQIVMQKGIREIYSMGPSPEADRALLENLAAMQFNARYCPVDVNESAAKAAIDEIAKHLTSAFGGESWKKHLTLGGCEPTRFEDVKNNSPACVIYGSGNIMNDRKLWLQAAKIAQKDGIVVASAAVTPDESDYSGYWLSFYDRPEGREMFEAALRKISPDFFTKENRGKWSIEWEYVPHNLRATAYWAHYHTPRISVQLSVHDEMMVTVDGSPMKLQPTRTWKEVDEWEDFRSGFRQGFDNDKSIEAAIAEAYNRDDSSLLPEECKKSYPIELVTSAKLLWPDFLMLVPQEFGLRRIRLAKTGIGYARNGKQGLAMAAVFNVDNAKDFVPGLKDVGMPKPWPPQYAHDPAYASWESTVQTLPRK